MLRIFKYLHFIGLAMLLLGIGLYSLSNYGNEVAGMLVIASLIGIGSVMMSPYPVVVFIEWAKKQDAEAHKPK